MPEKEHKTGKKMVVKKDKNSRKIVDVVSKTKSGEKKSLNKKTEEKGIKKGNKKLNAIKNIEDLSIQENKDIDVIDNFLLVQDIQIDQNPIPPRVRFRSLIFFVSKRNYFTIKERLFRKFNYMDREKSEDEKILLKYSKLFDPKMKNEYEYILTDAKIISMMKKNHYLKEYFKRPTISLRLKNSYQ